MLKKAIFLLALIGMVINVNVTSVFAYNLLGSQYRSSDIQFQYDSIKSSYQTVATSALNSWENSTDNVTFFPYYGTLEGLILGSYDAGNVGWNGMCMTTYGNDGYHLRSNIIGNEYYMDSMTSNERQGVYAHEIGHALGLDHVTNTSQVMCTWADGRQVYLPGNDDVAGANYLY